MAAATTSGSGQSAPAGFVHASDRFEAQIA
jgi:hypothetical protein